MKYKVSSHTIYIWRKKYGSMEPSRVSELKRITQENARLKKLDAENITASPGCSVRQKQRHWTTQANSLDWRIPFDVDVST
jgi:hypothetical protein